MKRLLVVTLLALAGCADGSLDPAETAQTDPAVVPADAAAVTFAMLPSGEAIAWVDSTKRLLVRPADGGEPVVVAGEGVSSHGQAGPQLAPLPDGGLVAVYVVERAVEGRRFPASDLWVARSDDGGRTWAAPIRPYPDAGIPTGHTFHSVAAGADGTVVVAWLDGTARDRYDQQMASNAAPVRLVQDGESRQGDASHAAPAAEPGTQVLLARSSDGGRTFAAPVTVADGSCQCCQTALTVAADGTVYAAWRHIFDGGERDMALARSDDGGATFGAAVRVHHDGWAIDGCPHSGPAVTTDVDGAVHVAWATGAPDRMGLWRAVSTDRGATFGEPSPLAVPAPLGQVRAANPGGRAVFAFEDPRTTTVAVLAVGSTDTLRVAGDAASLATDGDAWRLLWNDGDGVRQTDADRLRP